MNLICATVNKTLPFSCVDGPGNRLVLFLQGCNFRCKNCHNPYTIGFCDHCGDCVVACRHEALSLKGGKIVWDFSVCQQCDTCLQTCVRSSSPMTQQLTVAEALVTIREYLPFLTGVTLSGGEATQQYRFIYALFSAIKNTPDLQHLSCFVDSNGSCSLSVWETLLPVMDATMIDLKAWSVDCHHRLTGRGNQRVVASLRYLAEHKKLYEVRLLLIPNQTDYEQNVLPLSRFLLSLGDDVRIKLNAFQKHGLRGEALLWQSATREYVESFAEQLRLCGVKNVVTPVTYLTK